jgi:predicted alpha/beta-fold hydrolase
MKSRAERNCDAIEIFVAHFRGKTYKEIAMQVGLSVGRVNQLGHVGQRAMHRVYNSNVQHVGHVLLATELANFRLKSCRELYAQKNKKAPSVETKRPVNDKKGADMGERPMDLRVREMLE